MNPSTKAMTDNGWLRQGAIIHIALISSIIGALYYLYHYFGVTDVGYDIQDTTRSAFRWLYERWVGDWAETKFAHSHWVPLISLLLVWLNRKNLTALPRRVQYSGWAVIIFALLLHWAGAKTQQTRLTILSMVVLSWSIPLFACGWPVAKRLLFPCGFLIFSLPLNFFDAAAYPLRTLSAYVASGLLNGLGLVVERSGSVVIMDSNRFNLGDSCNGIFAVTAIIAFSLVCAYLVRAAWWKRAVIVAASVPLLVFANVLRGLFAAMITKFANPEMGLRFFDLASGPIVVVVAFGGLVFLAWRQHNPSTVGMWCNEGASQNRAAWPALLVTLATLICAIVWIPANLYVQHIKDPGINMDWPSSIGSWYGVSLFYCHNADNPIEVTGDGYAEGDACPECGEPLWSMAVVEKSLLPGDTIVKKMQFYHATRNDRIQCAVVVSGKDRSSIHRPEVCLVGPNSEIISTYVHTVKLRGDKTVKLRVLEMVVRVSADDGKLQYVPFYFAYWFRGAGHETPYHLQRMAWMAYDRLFKSTSSRWAYISISGVREVHGKGHLNQITDFVKNVHALL